MSRSLMTPLVLIAVLVAACTESTVGPSSSLDTTSTSNVAAVTSTSRASTITTTSSRDHRGEGWMEIEDAPIGGRYVHSVVWTGTEVLVWGGQRSGRFLDDGAAYDPNTDNWRLLATSPLRARARHTAVWTGEVMIVWGGDGSPAANANGALYDPHADTWIPIADAGLGPHSGHTATWIGSEMIIYGGRGFASDDPVALAYDPTQDRWRSVTESGLGNRSGHTAVWTGFELIIWGGWVFDPETEAEITSSSGAAYDPVTDEWRQLANSPLAPRSDHSAVWTGTELVIWGGTSAPSSPGSLSDGAAYDPVLDTWRTLPDSPLAGRSSHSAIWTGDAMLIWGGHVRTSGSSWLQFGDGAILGVADSEWSRVAPAAFTSTVMASPTIWTGQVMILWGLLSDLSEAGGWMLRLPPD